MAEAGYSGTPLPKKLGLKHGQSVLFAGLPETLEDLACAADFMVADRAESLSDFKAANAPYDVIHAFTKEKRELVDNLGELESALRADGMIWISWPKKAAKIASDVTEDVVREQALKHHMVDVKVCAIDAVWSGLKLVIRKELRHLH